MRRRHRSRRSAGHGRPPARHLGGIGLAQLSLRSRRRRRRHRAAIGSTKARPIITSITPPPSGAIIIVAPGVDRHRVRHEELARLDVRLKVERLQQCRFGVPWTYRG